MLVQRIEHGNIFELLCILKHPSAHTLKMGDACIDGLLRVNPGREDQSEFLCIMGTFFSYLASVY